MSDDDDGYEINDPRTREHKAYKIAQDNRGRATRRFKYGDDVDERTSLQGDEESPAGGDDDGSEESVDGEHMDEQLRNAREARGWAVDEANRRYGWNGQWTGGVHEGIEEQADARMEEVTGKRGWNEKIEQLERAIAERDAKPGSPDVDGDDSPDLEEDEHNKQENLWEDRPERERGHRYAQDFNEVGEGDDEGGKVEEGEESESEEGEESRSEESEVSGSEDDNVLYDEDAGSESD